MPREEGEPSAEEGKPPNAAETSHRMRRSPDFMIMHLLGNLVAFVLGEGGGEAGNDPSRNAGSGKSGKEVWMARSGTAFYRRRRPLFT